MPNEPPTRAPLPASLEIVWREMAKRDPYCGEAIMLTALDVERAAHDKTRDEFDRRVIEISSDLNIALEQLDKIREELAQSKRAYQYLEEAEARAALALMEKKR